MSGVSAIPAITVSVVRQVINVKVAERKSFVSLWVRESRCFLKVGIKATEILFSAKSRRSKFGITKATEKASESAEVPRNAAFIISRTKPRIRDEKVSIRSFEPLLTKDFDIIQKQYHKALAF